MSSSKKFKHKDKYVFLERLGEAYRNYGSQEIMELGIMEIMELGKV